MRTAIIDMGTNTFNLLVGNVEEGEMEIMHSSRIAVKIGKGGINQGEILPDAIERALLALVQLKAKANEFGVDVIKALATSAVRTASNQQAFIEQIKQTTDIDVTVISGTEEARLICQGVRQAVPLEDRKVLILDIGGGSNELIIADAHTLYWKQSYPLGMARLLAKFGACNPIAANTLAAMEMYMADNLPSFREAVATWQPTVLVGASGAFESFLLMKNHSLSTELPAHAVYNMNDYFDIYQQLVASTLEERMTMPGIELMRADMIAHAAIFVTFILKLTGIQHMEYSDYALKEGMLYELAIAGPHSK